MDKKIFGVALIATMAVAASWNFNQSKNEIELSDLALANVEALAQGEGSKFGYYNPIEDCCDTGGIYLCYYDC